MTIREAFRLRDPDVRAYIVVICTLSLVIAYGFRAVRVEVLRMAEIGVLIELLECAVSVAGLLVWVYLAWKSIRLVRQTVPALALLLAVIVAPIASYLAPIPPSREEIRLWQRRSEYEAVAQEAFSRAEYHNGSCVASDAQESGLSRDCLQVDSNSVLFQVYDGVVFLVYSVDGKPPTDVFCDWDGTIVKQIDQHWSLCLRDLG